MFRMISNDHFENFDNNWRLPVDPSYINEQCGIADLVFRNGVAESEVKNIANSVPQSWICNKKNVFEFSLNIASEVFWYNTILYCLNSM